jgi:putative DNA primase/helicase
LKKDLPPPAIINSATEEYRNEKDVLGNFIKECCVQSPGASIRARELFRAYQEWCEERNERACNERFLGLRLKELGMERFRTEDCISVPTGRDEVLAGEDSALENCRGGKW